MCGEGAGGGAPRRVGGDGVPSFSRERHWRADCLLFVNKSGTVFMKKVSVCLCGRATGGLVGPPPENNPPRFLGARRTPGGGPSPLAAPSREKKKSDPTSPRVCGATIGGGLALPYPSIVCTPLME